VHRLVVDEQARNRRVPLAVDLFHALQALGVGEVDALVFEPLQLECGGDRHARM
jgi:hypothetical protein